jgi:DNA polymerase III subunit chi
MTDIAFHVGIADVMGYACRLVRKAYASGAGVCVCAQAETLARLDQALWTFSPLDFIAHDVLTADAAAPAANASAPAANASAPAANAACGRPASVELVVSAALSGNHQVLINLEPQIPQAFERFERLIELVSAAPDDLAAARERWKHYKSKGYPLLKHELA